MLRLTTNASLTHVIEGNTFLLDQPLFLVLGPDETMAESPGDSFYRHFRSTRIYWQEFSRSLSIPFEWQEAVIRAAITLKLCTFEDTGAVVAALTTSIPEAAAQRPQLGLPLLLAQGQLLRRAGAQSPGRDHDHGAIPSLHH